MQLGLKTIFGRLCDSGYDGSQTGSIKSEQLGPAAELEQVDQIAVAIMTVYSRGTRPEHKAKAHISDIVLEALNSFVWTDEHDLLAHNTGHGQNFLHICVTGDYARLLGFFLDHGCGDPEKQDRKDDFGRTARELAGVMERKEIELLLSSASTRTEPLPDLRGSYKPRQIEYADALRSRTLLTLHTRALTELAQRWIELRQVHSQTQEVIWELQSYGRWRKFDEPRFKRDNDRVKVRRMA